MVIRNSLLLSFSSLAVLASGCNVASTSSNTGGGGAVGEVAILTDYTSTQVALLGPDGTPTSASFLSSASTKASGLAYPLSGDVAVPTTKPASGLVVLLDRYGTNIITWADPADGKVLDQLPVGTGFDSNPYDYLETDSGHALVPRWGVNDKPGAQPFDEGSDVLVIDTKSHAITASIAMPSTNGLPPRPASIIPVGSTSIVLLQNISEDFATYGDSVLVGIVNDAVAWQQPVTGLKGCNRPALSPSGKVMALSCEGQLDMNGNVVSLAESAVALYDVTSLPPKPIKQFAIADQLGSPTQDRVAFATETLIVGKTQTPQAGTTNNQAFSLDTGTGKVTVLLTAGVDPKTGTGKGIVYGDFVCTSSMCLLADGDVGKVQRWTLSGGALTATTPLTVGTVGLPPVAFGAY
jgi:hypothetical protein